MPITIPESDKHGFQESCFQAEHDARTTGFFLVLIAPRDDGYCRESVLAAGDLPIEPILARLLPLAVRGLNNINTEQQP